MRFQQTAPSRTHRRRPGVQRACVATCVRRRGIGTRSPCTRTGHVAPRDEHRRWIGARPTPAVQAHHGAPHGQVITESVRGDGHDESTAAVRVRLLLLDDLGSKVPCEQYEIVGAGPRGAPRPDESATRIRASACRACARCGPRRNRSGRCRFRCCSAVWRPSQRLRRRRSFGRRQEEKTSPEVVRQHPRPGAARASPRAVEDHNPIAVIAVADSAHRRTLTELLVGRRLERGRGQRSRRAPRDVPDARAQHRAHRRGRAQPGGTPIAEVIHTRGPTRPRARWACSRRTWATRGTTSRRRWPTATTTSSPIRTTRPRCSRAPRPTCARRASCSRSTSSGATHRSCWSCRRRWRRRSTCSSSCTPSRASSPK